MNAENNNISNTVNYAKTFSSTRKNFSNNNGLLSSKFLKKMSPSSKINPLIQGSSTNQKENIKKRENFLDKNIIVGKDKAMHGAFQQYKALQTLEELGQGQRKLNSTSMNINLQRADESAEESIKEENKENYINDNNSSYHSFKVSKKNKQLSKSEIIEFKHHQNNSNNPNNSLILNSENLNLHSLHSLNIPSKKFNLINKEGRYTSLLADDFKCNPKSRKENKLYLNQNKIIRNEENQEDELNNPNAPIHSKSNIITERNKSNQLCNKNKENDLSQDVKEINLNHADQTIMKTDKLNINNQFKRNKKSNLDRKNTHEESQYKDIQPRLHHMKMVDYFKEHIKALISIPRERYMRNSDSNNKNKINKINNNQRLIESMINFEILGNNCLNKVNEEETKDFLYSNQNKLKNKLSYRVPDYSSALEGSDKIKSNYDSFIMTDSEHFTTTLDSIITAGNENLANKTNPPFSTIDMKNYFLKDGVEQNYFNYYRMLDKYNNRTKQLLNTKEIKDRIGKLGIIKEFEQFKSSMKSSKNQDSNNVQTSLNIDLEGHKGSTTPRIDQISNDNNTGNNENSFILSKAKGNDFNLFGNNKKNLIVLKMHRNKSIFILI